MACLLSIFAYFDANLLSILADFSFCHTVLLPFQIPICLYLSSKPKRKGTCNWWTDHIVLSDQITDTDLYRLLPLTTDRKKAFDDMYSIDPHWCEVYTFSLQD